MNYFTLRDDSLKNLSLIQKDLGNQVQFLNLENKSLRNLKKVRNRK